MAKQASAAYNIVTKFSTKIIIKFQSVEKLNALHMKPFMAKTNRSGRE